MNNITLIGRLTFDVEMRFIPTSGTPVANLSIAVGTGRKDKQGNDANADVVDDAVHDEEYVLRTYDYPILGKVPDLLNTGNKSYGYYSAKSTGKRRS